MVTGAPPPGTTHLPVHPLRTTHLPVHPLRTTTQLPAELTRTARQARGGQIRAAGEGN